MTTLHGSPHTAAIPAPSHSFAAAVAVLFALVAALAFFAVPARAQTNLAPATSPLSAPSPQSIPDDPAALLKAGNDAYERSQFADAVALYERALRLAPGDPVILYNLGNACTRTTEYGRAALAYERLLRLAPDDEEARDNLRKIAPQNFPPPDSVTPFTTAWQWIRTRMGVNAWLFTSFLLFLAGVVGATLWILGGPRARLGRILVLSALAPWLFVSLVAISHVRRWYAHEAIVIYPRVIARSGPSLDSREAMELPPGTRLVRSGEPERGWIRIRTIDGRVAFVEVKNIDWI